MRVVLNDGKTKKRVEDLQEADDRHHNSDPEPDIMPSDQSESDQEGGKFTTALPSQGRPPNQKPLHHGRSRGVSAYPYSILKLILTLAAKKPLHQVSSSTIRFSQKPGPAARVTGFNSLQPKMTSKEREVHTTLVAFVLN